MTAIARYVQRIGAWPLWLQPAGMMSIYAFPFALLLGVIWITANALDIRASGAAVSLLLLAALQVSAVAYGIAQLVLGLRTSTHPFLLAALASMGFSLTLYVAGCIKDGALIGFTKAGIGAAAALAIIFGVLWKYGFAHPDEH